MRAALYYGKEDVRIEDIPEPECKDGYVKVKPAFVGICGSDLHEYLGGPTFAPTKGKPHPVTGGEIPIVLGHEFSGVVHEIGRGVEGFTVGQHVVVQPTLACSDIPGSTAKDHCGVCDLGAENCCYKAGFIGLSGGGGGLSSAVVVPPNRVIPLPEKVPLDIGALVEPLSVAWHAVTASKIRAGQSALILGGGPIGLAVIQALKAQGVDKVFVSEVATERQNFAKKFGATKVLDPRHEDVPAECNKLCDGMGPDVVFDCAGVPASIRTAGAAVRSLGTIVNVAIWEKEVPFNPNMLVFRESHYLGVLGYLKKDFEAVISALDAGSLKPGPMITRKIKLDDFVDDGLLALINEKEKHVKILIDLTA